jgi:type VI secretion system secreted protein Hcp
MPFDVFLELKSIQGESKDALRPKHIDVLSYSFGVVQTGSFHRGGGGGAGKVAVQDVVVTKRTDRASPDLYLACCNGRHIPEATLIVRKAGENPLEYLTIHLEDVIISSFQTNAAGVEPTESVSFSFAKMEIEYTEQNSQGGAGATTTMGWDIKANAKL